MDCQFLDLSETTFATRSGHASRPERQVHDPVSPIEILETRASKAGALHDLLQPEGMKFFKRTNC